MHQESPNESINLHAYLERIGLRQPTAPDLQTLRAIIAAHVAAIPFENLDPFLGVPVAIDLASVQRKLVDARRGGYCFEQNGLLGAALRAIGFSVTNLAARVLRGQPDDAITARSHMLLRIDLGDDAWLADAGFGGTTPTAPLRLVPDIEQPTAHEPFRVQRRAADDWRLQVTAGGEWKTLYRFDLTPQYPIDNRARNWWTSTSPESHFVTGLTVSRAPAGQRLTLRNRDFTVRAMGEATTRRTLRGAAEIRAVLRGEFLIRLPDHPLLDQKLNQLPDPA